MKVAKLIVPDLVLNVSDISISHRLPAAMGRIPVIIAKFAMAKYYYARMLPVRRIPLIQWRSSILLLNSSIVKQTHVMFVYCLKS